MDPIERQMRARNCPNPDDTPDFLEQSEQLKTPLKPVDRSDTVPIKPADRHEKGGDAKSGYNRSNTETF